MALADLLERALQLRPLILQQFEHVGAIGGDVRGDLAVAIDIEAHVDAAEFGRVGSDLEPVGTGLGAGGIATARSVRTGGADVASSKSAKGGGGLA